MFNWIKFKNRHYKFIILLIISLVTFPSLKLLFNGLSDITAYKNIPLTIVWEYLKQTFWLCLGVSFFTNVLGITFSILIVFFEFKGKKILEWALILPFMFPAYILAYIYTDFFEYSGFLQTFLREIFGWQSKADYWFPEIRGMGGAIFTLSICFYPYIYIITRSAFYNQSTAIIQTGQLLGKNFIQTLLLLILPLTKKSIFLGLIIVVVHCIQDFGTVEYFSVYTISLGIYDLWLNRGDFATASLLSSILMLGIFSLVLMETKLTPKTKNIENQYLYLGQLKQFTPFVSYLLGIFCFIPVILGFLLPSTILIFYTIQNYTILQKLFFWQIAFNSIKVAFLATSITLFLSFIVTYIWQKLNRSFDFVCKSTILGYSLPSTVLAIGIILATTSLDYFINNIWKYFFDYQLGLLFSGSILILILAYTIKFFVIPQSIFVNSIELVTPSIDASGRNLGYYNFRIVKNIYLPIMNKGTISAALILFVEIIKELPISLILRPVGFENLATYLYQFASDEMIEKAAAVALFIILIGSIPLILLCLSLIKTSKK